MPAHIRHLVTINCSPYIVYNALTTKTGIQGWWTSDTVIEPKIGTIAEFIFGNRYHNKMEITDLLPNTRVAWLCKVGDHEWVGTDFTFDLEGNDSQTLFRFGHNKWEEQTDFFAYCNFKWGYYLMSLKQYCETGIGNPFVSSSDKV